MSIAAVTRTCAMTGIRLLANDPTDRFFRIAKPKYGPLSAPIRVSGSDPRQWGRYDTAGSTLYVASEATSAFAEVLSPFKRQVGTIDPLEADAAALGLKRDEFLEIIATEWAEHGFMGVGAIPAMWRHDRAVFEIAAAGTGWWVDVEHPDTLSVLEAELKSVLAEQRVTALTTAVLRGENRIITGAVAALVRGWTFDDGTSARGIHFGSKFGGGTCRAIWLPDTELISLSPEAILVTDERLALAADRFRIRVF